MKTIIFSDTHLTDKFDPRKFVFLENILKDADQIIINGDLWEYFAISFEQFLNSKWASTLFPILKSKETIYIPGNHDPSDLLDDRTTLFSSKVTGEHRMQLDGDELVVRHGDDLFPSLDVKMPLLKNHFTKQLVMLYPRIMTKLLGFNAYYPMSLWDIKASRTWALKNMRKDEILVLAHTHLPEFSPEKKLINTGFIMSGFASYLEINDNDIKLIKTKY